MAAKLTQEEVLSRFKEVNGDKFSYGDFVFTNISTHCLVTCKIHGNFSITPKNHFKGRGCGKCAGVGLSNEEWIARFRIVHGDKFHYPNFSYISAKTPMEIVCSLGHSFKQTPNKHTSGQGCPTCVGKNITTEEVLIRFKELYGDRYSYSGFVYTTAKAEFTARCKLHGTFMTSPDRHFRSGCPDCATCGPSHIYLLKESDTGAYKIGVSTNVTSRIKTLDKGPFSYSVVALSAPLNRSLALSLESGLHKKYADNQVNGYARIYEGSTEIFNLSDEQVQEVIEYLESL